jgi:hypothetical protein
MPIKEYLHGHQFSPEMMQVMGVAFEMARASNKLLDRPDITDAMIGKQIVALVGWRTEHRPTLRSGIGLVCALPPPKRRRTAKARTAKAKPAPEAVEQPSLRVAILHGADLFMGIFAALATFAGLKAIRRA